MRLGQGRRHCHRVTSNCCFPVQRISLLGRRTEPHGPSACLGTKVPSLEDVIKPATCCDLQLQYSGSHVRPHLSPPSSEKGCGATCILRCSFASLSRAVPAWIISNSLALDVGNWCVYTVPCSLAMLPQLMPSKAVVSTVYTRAYVGPCSVRAMDAAVRDLVMEAARWQAEEGADKVTR